MPLRRLLVLGFAFLGALHAQSQRSVADRKGDFTTQPVGILTQGPFAGPFTAAGVIHFDGAGQFAGVATSSFNGKVIYPFLATGFYNVTPDCLLTTLETTLRIAFEGYITDTRNEVYLFQPDAGAITTATLHRRDMSSCNEASLRGTFGIQAAGSNIIAQGRIAQSGRLTFDGAGGLSGATVSSVNGALLRTTLTGTYRIDTDCTFQARLVDATGTISHIFGMLFDAGNQFIFDYSDDGLVIAGQAKRTVAPFCNPHQIPRNFHHAKPIVDQIARFASETINPAFHHFWNET
jgi:hypothetical protein